MALKVRTVIKVRIVKKIND